jgi:hypothetical protein
MTNTSSIKNKNLIGFISSNILLKNVTEYLVEESDAEEELSENSNTFETDKELIKVIKEIASFSFHI